MQKVLEDAPRAAEDAKLLIEQLHILERANLTGHDLDFETRMGVAMDLLEVTDRLRSYAMRVRG